MVNIIGMKIVQAVRAGTVLMLIGWIIPVKAQVRDSDQVWTHQSNVTKDAHVKSNSSLKGPTNDIDGVDFFAVPNPVGSRNKSTILVCRTPCIGTADVNIYDAVGSIVYQTTEFLNDPAAMGYSVHIPWNCRNRQGRLVGKGTYHAVVRVYDQNNRLVVRRSINIGVAY